MSDPSEPQPLTREQESAIFERVEFHQVARSALTRLLRNSALLAEAIDAKDVEIARLRDALAAAEEKVAALEAELSRYRNPIHHYTACRLVAGHSGPCQP